ncbi:MAG: inositol monophosphatase [Alphaproteobacteria bacterium]|nr:inositol monophosphatase [Alphaproteobacteria bacterium]
MPALIDDVSALMREVAAAEILPRFRDAAASRVREKTGPADLVTEADLAAERVLTPRLAALVPGSIVIGEEAATDDPRLLDALAEAEQAWLIDPVDGTINFASGLPMFAVMVALVRRGETVAGWIYDPIHGRLAVAEKGAGARDAQGRKIAIAPRHSLDRAVGEISLSRMTPEEVARVAPRMRRFASTVSWRVGGWSYLGLAEGALQASHFVHLMPWDHAAGVLIVEEAGGHSRHLDGSPYRPAQRRWPAALLSACDAATWRAVVDEVLS